MPEAKKVHMADLTKDYAGNPEPDSYVTEEDPNIPLDEMFYLG